MTPEQKIKAEELARSSVNRNLLELQEADGRERAFVHGFAAGIIERNKELLSQTPRFQITADISRKILSECEFWADWHRMSDTDKGETIEGVEGILYLYHKQVYQQVVALQSEISRLMQASRVHISTMNDINAHLGYPFSQPLIKFSKETEGEK